MSESRETHEELERYELIARHKELDAKLVGRAKQDGIFSRGTAAEIFEKLGEDVGFGVMPEDVSPYAIGRAISRTLPNNDLGERHNGTELLRGLFSLDEAQREQVMSLIQRMEAENRDRARATREQLGDSFQSTSEVADES